MSNNLLVGQPRTRIGFHADGKLPRSATNLITKEIEQATLTSINKKVRDTATSNPQSIKTQIEVMSYQNVDRYSAAFLDAIPNRLGFFTDLQFKDAVAQYLGLPSPSLVHLTDQFIGAGENIQAVDPHGIAISNACLPGGCYIRAHSKIQAVIRDITRLTGKQIDLEASNFFLGKIPAEAQHAYDAANLENPKRDAIIPDGRIHNFGRNTDLIFEVKRNGINRNLSNYSITSEKRAVDKKAEWIRRDCIHKCKQCDVKFAMDTSDSGPFLTALESYEGGGIYPIAIGAFGETNKEVDKFLQRCARLASARQEGVSLSPLAQQHFTFVVQHHYFEIS